MGIKPKKQLKERMELHQSIIDLLFNGEADRRTDGWKVYVQRFFDPDCIKKAWKSYGKELLKQWIKVKPCTRPWGWWKYAASDKARKRLGGTGDPASDFLSYAPHFEYGVPTTWITKFDVEYYNGRARDVHGEIIPTNYKGGNFKGVAIDPKNPPCYQSETAFLLQHNLLTVGERKHLEKHPELLEPEPVDGGGFGNLLPTSSKTS